MVAAAGSCDSGALAVASIVRQKTQSNQHNAEHDVCEHCLAIPWKQLAAASQDSKWSIDEHNTSNRESCRICRFLEAFDAMSTPWGMEPPSRRLDHTNVCANINGLSSTSDGLARILVSHQPLNELDPDFNEVFPREVDIDLVRRWVHECDIGHSSCAWNNFSTLVSLKVIDCKQLIVVPAPPNCRYIALSYLWGKPSLQQEASFSGSSQNLPKTIQHSLEITRALGYDYLWIDRYCIEQNNVSEKLIQIAQMGSIYAAAQLTIVAAAGDDPTHSLPRAASAPRSRVRSESVGPIYLSLIPPLQGLAVIGQTKWATRGWTFQEGFLSRRRLIFTDDQTIFVCNSTTHYEGPAVGERHDMFDSPMRQGLFPEKASSWVQWDSLSRAMHCLEHYSNRVLTYEADSLNAILGALNTFVEKSVYHIWGVPFGRETTKPSAATPGLESGLALFWYHTEPCTRRAGFPSWSPAGWGGRIAWVLGPPKYMDTLMTANTRAVSVLTTEGIANDIPSLTISQLTGLMNAKPQLVITSKSADLRLIQTSPFSSYHQIQPGSLETSTHGVVVPFDDEHQVVLDVKWDRQPHTTTFIKAALIPTACGMYSATKDYVDCIILLQHNDLYFERVGIAWLVNAQHPYSGDQADVPWLCDRNFRSLPRDGETQARVKVRAAGVWWRRLFGEETIVLG